MEVKKAAMEQASYQNYLNRVKDHGLEPNFYLSEAYMRLQGLKCWNNGKEIWVEDDEWIVFPYLNKNSLFVPHIPKGKKLWCAFSDMYTTDHTKKILDWEYIFDPKRFNNMIGGNWEVFRKNCRKWPKNNPYFRYSSYLDQEEDLFRLVGNWVEEREETIQDGEFLIRFAIETDKTIVKRKFLYNIDGQIIGVNAWDENFQYINYRICMNNGENYLDEFMRLLFYTDPDIQNSGKLVNDGGVLDRDGLRTYKNKMNPIKIKQIYSWINK